ncbi:MAG TPA: patatin-like phospholipase family protein [Acidimicrobiales bacterium]|nr:patatin-like phospholipase family protein [Acidimicrobiales bacterium]
MTSRADRSHPVDPALPRDFDAGYGAGVSHGLCLGGGGLFFVAWQVAYLHALAEGGLKVDAADRVVGTSAGSVVATVLLGGRLNLVQRELSILAKAPRLLSALAPASDLTPSQQRALDLFWQAQDSEPATLRAIGHAALASAGPSPRTMRRNLSVVIGAKRWPSPALNISCVDAYTGERCIVTRETGVSVAAAAAASSAVPGLFPPQPIADRWCMDGGVSGSGTHLDVLAGAKRVLVLALSDGSELTEGMMTNQPGSSQHELDDLAASGTKVELRTPEVFDPLELMSPTAVPKAMAMGARQASTDLAGLTSFWT